MASSSNIPWQPALFASTQAATMAFGATSHWATLGTERLYNSAGTTDQSGAAVTRGPAFRDPHDPEVRLFLHYGDLTDAVGLRRVLGRVMPHKVCNLVGQPHVKVSFEHPEYHRSAPPRWNPRSSQQPNR